MDVDISTRIEAQASSTNKVQDVIAGVLDGPRTLASYSYTRLEYDEERGP